MWNFRRLDYAEPAKCCLCIPVALFIHSSWCVRFWITGDHLRNFLVTWTSWSHSRNMTKTTYRYFCTVTTVCYLLFVVSIPFLLNFAHSLNQGSQPLTADCTEHTLQHMVLISNLCRHRRWCTRGKNSVRPSVRLSRSSIVSERFNISSYFLQHMIAPSF